MKKLVILLGLFFVIGCDQSDYDFDTDWETDSELVDQPSGTPDLTGPGNAPGVGSKVIDVDRDSDDLRVGNDFERVSNPIFDRGDERSKLR